VSLLTYAAYIPQLSAKEKSIHQNGRPRGQSIFGMARELRKTLVKYAEQRYVADYN
jgi:hypothetical protein